MSSRLDTYGHATEPSKPALPNRSQPLFPADEQTETGASIGGDMLEGDGYLAEVTWRIYTAGNDWTLDRWDRPSEDG